MRKVTPLLALLILVGLSSLKLQAADIDALDKALSMQADEAKARYSSRNPKETLEFFGVEPGMKVAEALPGGGWYSKILLPYLGKDGELVGVDYSIETWAQFGFSTPESLKERESWAETWTARAQGWGDENSAAVSAYPFDEVPEDLQLDAVLLIRALHNLAAFEANIGALQQALEASYKALKPGGIVGIVQHQADESRSDEWANGSKGYLKKSFVIERMENVGFEFVGEIDVNNNELDQPKDDEVVWRLPPNLRTAEENKEAMKAIGESNRMTLKFRKP